MPTAETGQVGANADRAPRDERDGEALAEGARVGARDGAAAAEALDAKAVLRAHHIRHPPPTLACQTGKPPLHTGTAESTATHDKRPPWSLAEERWWQD